MYRNYLLPSNHHPDEPFTPPEPSLVRAFSLSEWRNAGYRSVPIPKEWEWPTRRKVANPCGAHTRNGTPCQQPAGKGTDHAGVGPCSLHDGTYWGERQGRQSKKAQKITEQLVLDYVERNRMAGVYGTPQDIDPHTALLQEVQRTAGHVEWLRQLITEIGEEDPNNRNHALSQWTPLGIQPSVWISLYQEERKHLVKVSTAAINAGVAERHVQIAQDQARMLAMVIKAFLLDPRMEFTPRQRLAAPEVVRQLLQRIPSEGTLEGHILEVESVETNE